MTGGAEREDGGEPPDALVLAARIEALTEQLLAAPVWRLSGAEVAELVRVTGMAGRKLDAAHLAAIADLDGRPGALPDVPARFQARTFLQGVLHRTKGQARLDLLAATSTRPGADAGQRGLPRMGAALAAGAVSREHVDVAVRAMQVMPNDLLPALLVDEHGAPIAGEDGVAMCAGDVIDERLTAFAQEHDSHALAQLAKELKDRLDPDGNFDPGQGRRRRVQTWWGHDGLFHLRGVFDPASGALLDALIDHYASPRRYRGETDDGENAEAADPRTPEQRRADSVIEIAQRAAASGQAVTRAGEPPRITVITRAEDLAAARSRTEPAAEARTGGPPPVGGAGGGHLGTGAQVDPWLLARLACDAVLERALLAPSGALLDLGREVRTVTPAQKRALIARDRGCVIPGCTIPGAWCEAHHVQPWSSGGASDLGNYVLVCLQHHTEIHTGMWVLEMRDGVPWVIPPTWIDPRRRPCRNRYHEQLQGSRDLGAHLRASLDGGTTRLPEHPPAPRAGRDQGDPDPPHEAAA